jgi:Ca2+-binding RTX toxin-like protein
MQNKLSVLAACAVALASTAASGAHAATVTFEEAYKGSNLEILAAPAEANRLHVDARPFGLNHLVTVSDPGAHGLLTTSPGCVSVAARRVVCQGSFPRFITIRLLDADDEARVGGDFSLTGGATMTVMDGGSGIDRLLGSPGVDVLIGGTGDDVFSGGEGHDRVDYSGALPVTASLDGQANDGTVGERDHILADIEELYGSSLGDQLTGGPGNDTLFGGDGDDDLRGEGGDDRLFDDRGADRLEGGPGRDELRSNSGADRIFARDGEVDTVSCFNLDGPTAEVDAIDEVFGDCG